MLREDIVFDLEELVFKKLKDKLQYKPKTYAYQMICGVEPPFYIATPKETMILFFKDIPNLEITLPEDWRTDLNKTVTYIYSKCFVSKLNPNILL
jgi:hypothetical protein